MALMVFGAILYCLWRAGAFLPGWIVWEKRGFFVEEEALEVRLDGKRVMIIRDGERMWSSPKGMRVQDVLSCDIDRDGNRELLLLGWKIGRYGKHRPFWVKRDESQWSQHIFVYSCSDGTIRQKWASSYIGLDVLWMEAKDSGAAVQLLLTDRDGAQSGWIWDSWGFTRLESDRAPVERENRGNRKYLKDKLSRATIRTLWESGKTETEKE